MQYTIDQAISWTQLMGPFQGSDDPPAGAQGNGDPASDNGDGTGTSDPGGESGQGASGDGAKTFTQDEVNALVTRETQKATRGMLNPKDLGFSSKQDLADFLKKMKDKEEADKTESEKEVEARIKAAEDEARNSVLSKANQRLVKSEFVIAASKAGVAIPMDDAFQVAQTLEGYAPEVDEDTGSVSGFDDDFFKAFKAAKPYVFAKAGSSSDIGAGASGGGAKPSKEDELRQNYPSLGRALSASEAAGIRTR